MYQSICKILKDEEKLEMKILNVELKLRKISLLQLAAIFGLLTFGLLQTAQAQTQTFAQFTQQNSTNGFIFTNNAGASATLSTPINGTRITFRFLGIVGLDPSLQGDQCADIFVDANTNDPAQPGTPPNGYTQPFDTVIIQILRCTPAPVGANTRRNLLTATVTTGAPVFSGNLGGESGSFFASTPLQNVTFTSDFLSFANTVERNFALSFSSIIPQLALGPGGFFDSFTAAGTGTFASSPRPVICCITTPASVSVSGRVIAPNGRGLSGATVTLTEADGTVHRVRTSAFGHYRVADLTAGQTVIISVASKRYNFQPRTLNLNEDVENLNLLSGEPESRKSF